MRIVTISAMLLALSAVAASGASRARVSLDSVSPVVVVGAGFPVEAPVHVTVSAGATHLERTGRTTATGVFRVRWLAKVELPRCDGIAVSAVSGTTRALYKFSAAKAGCASPITP